MKRTEKLLINSCFILVLLIFTSSCKSNDRIISNTFQADCQDQQVKNQESKILTKELVLLKENCDNIVSFCDDGIGQIYRLAPLLLKNKDASNLFDLYDNNEVYSTNLLLLDDNFEEKYNTNKNIQFQNLSRKISNANVIDSVQFYSCHLRKSYSRMANSNFNGEFSFNRIKLKFDCVFLGKKCVTIPDMNRNSKKSKIKEVLVDYYVILQIK